MLTHVQGKTTTITRACVQCRKHQEVTAPTAGVVAWERGALIQDAFPAMSVDDREILISGVCGTCFDNLFTGGE